MNEEELALTSHLLVAGRTREGSMASPFIRSYEEEMKSEESFGKDVETVRG